MAIRQVTRIIVLRGDPAWVERVLEKAYLPNDGDLHRLMGATGGVNVISCVGKTDETVDDGDSYLFTKGFVPSTPIIK